jgi:hypothetical protein
MKTSLLAAVALTLAGPLCPDVHAQYKAPSQYFPKNSPVPKPGEQPKPGGQPAAPRQAPTGPAQPKFKDVAVNAQFYFTTDTNRAYAWTKLSATMAKNSKNGITQAINGETPVQR